MFNHSQSNIPYSLQDLAKLFAKIKQDLNSPDSSLLKIEDSLIATSRRSLALNLMQETEHKLKELTEINASPLNLAYNLGLRFSFSENLSIPTAKNTSFNPDLTTSITGLLNLLSSEKSKREEIENYIALQQEYTTCLIYNSALQALTQILDFKSESSHNNNSPVTSPEKEFDCTYFSAQLALANAYFQQLSTNLNELNDKLKISPDYYSKLTAEFKQFLLPYTTTVNTDEEQAKLTLLDFRELPQIQPHYQAYLTALSKLELVSQETTESFAEKKLKLTIEFLQQIFAINDLTNNQATVEQENLSDSPSSPPEVITSKVAEFKVFEQVNQSTLKSLFSQSSNQEAIKQEINKVLTWEADSYLFGEEKLTYQHPSLQKLDLLIASPQVSPDSTKSTALGNPLISLPSNRYWLKVANSNFSLKSWEELQRIRKLYTGDWFFERGNISLLELAITYFISKVIFSLSKEYNSVSERKGLSLSPYQELLLASLQLVTNLLPIAGLIPEPKKLEHSLEINSLALVQAPDYGFYGIANFDQGFLDLITQAQELGLETNYKLAEKYYGEELHPARILHFGYWKEVYFHLNPATLIPRDTTVSLIEKVAVAPEQEIQSYSKSFSFSVNYFSNYLLQKLASKPEQENLFFLTQEKLNKLSQLLRSIEKQGVAPALQNFLSFVEKKFTAELAGKTAVPLSFKQLEPYHLADLGTGSGILGIGLALELNHSLHLLGLSYPIKVILSDLSLRALAASLANIKVAYQWLFGHNVTDVEISKLSPISRQLYQDSKELLTQLPDLTTWYLQQEAKISQLEQLAKQDTSGTEATALLADQIKKLYQELLQLLSQFNQGLRTSKLWEQGFIPVEFELIWSSWLANFPSKYLNKLDIVISNPPYIGCNFFYNSELAKNDPMRALSDFGDGLSYYRDLLQQVKPYLKDQAAVILEFGFDQERQIKQLIAQQAYTQQAIWQQYLTAVAAKRIPEQDLLKQYFAQENLNQDSAEQKAILAQLSAQASYFAEEIYLYPTEYIYQQMAKSLPLSNKEAENALFTGNYHYEQSFFENSAPSYDIEDFANQALMAQHSELGLSQSGSPKPILLGGWLSFKRK